MADIMGEQTAVFNSMTSVLTEAEQGGDPSEAAKKLASLGEELKQLKIRLSELDYSRDQVSEGGIADREDFADATAAFHKAQQKLFTSGKLTPEIDKALGAHRNTAPMPGEGTTE